MKPRFAIAVRVRRLYQQFRICRQRVNRGKVWATANVS